MTPSSSPTALVKRGYQSNASNAGAEVTNRPNFGHQRLNGSTGLPGTSDMETWVPIARKLVVISIWLYVGYQMIPAARAAGRNPVRWYCVGLLAFYIPLAAIGFGVPALMLIAINSGVGVFAEHFDRFGTAFFAFGAVFGFASLGRARRLASQEADRRIE